MPQDIANLWTLSELSTELDIHPKSLAKKIRDLPPNHESRGAKQWYMSEVVKHIYSDGALSPLESKARLDSIRADEIEYRLEIQKGFHVRREVLEKALFRVSEIVRTGVNTIPSVIKKGHPDIGERTTNKIRYLIEKICDDISRTQLSEEDLD